MAKKAHRTSVALDDSQFGQLQVIARSKNVSLGWVIRQALDEYLRKEDQPDLFSVREPTAPSIHQERSDTK